MPDRRRSLSPNTETSFNQNPTESSNKLSNGSLKLKPSTTATANASSIFNQSSTYSPRGRKPERIDNDIDLDGPLLTNFESSDKRKRLSIQGHPPASGIPRSSVFNSSSLPQNKLRSYLIICNDLKTSEEELNNDLEVRVTTKDNYSRSIGTSDVEDFSMSRDVSPFVNLPTAPNSDIITGATRFNENEDDDYDDKVSDGSSVVYNEGALVVQKEFGSLYQDEDGNLVRPPFINLDPRERYQLLQLKRSIELSESLQKRIKYMINPNETTSKRIPGTNKVEISTQTHDFNYLLTKLNFKKRSPPSSFDRSEISRPKKKPKRKGFAMKEFLYDVNEEKPVSSTSSFNGALGSITKPKFNSHPKTQDKSMTQIIPREDEEPSFKTFGNKTGRDRETFGLNNNAKLTLDPEYLEKTSSSSIADIIKLKEPDVVENSKLNKPTTGPSSGFKFDIKKNDFESIINDRKQNQELLAKSKLAKETVPESVKSTEPNQSAKTGLFGSKHVSSEEAPKKKRNFSDSEKEDKPSVPSSVPSFLFGSTNTSKPATPSLFGNKENGSTTPSLFSITNSKSNDAKDATSTTKPLFGKSSTEPESNSEKPKFTFGAPPSSNKPSFTFGKSLDSAEKQTTADSKPSLFGNTFKATDKVESSTTSKPLFSFGSNNTTTTPISSNGSEKKDATPSSTPFAFDKPDTTKDEAKPQETTSLFGGKSKSGTTTPFTFGQKDDKATSDSKEEDKLTSTTKPASTGFIFGAPPKATESSVESKGETNSDAASATTATTTSTTTTPFKFGITNKASTESDEKKAEESATKKFNFVTPSTDKPSTPFSFPSANGSSTSKPAFSLGGIGTTDDKEKKETSSSPAVTQSTSAAPLTTSAFSFSAKKPDSPATSSTGADAAKSLTGSGFKFAAGVTPPSQTVSNKPPSIFNFGAASQPPTTSVFGGFGQPSQPPSSSGGIFGGKSPFGQSTNNAFNQNSNTSGIFGSKTGTTPSTNAFGGMNNPSSTSTPATSNVFGGASTGAGVPTTNVFGSRPTTPAFNFGGSAPTVAPGGFGAAGTKPPLFNFAGSKESTPDPASLFGQQNRSGTSTPFSSGGVGAPNNVFGQPGQPGQQPGLFGGASNNNSFTFGGAPSMPGATGTPAPPVAAPGGMNMPVVTPVPNPRRILQPRSRRR